MHRRYPPDVMARLITSRVRQFEYIIEEAPNGNGWTIEGMDWHPTAADAVKSINSVAQQNLKGGISTVAIIIWKPRTVIGRQVVKALKG